MSNIKQGYKQTDIGVIPEDWEVKPIKECAKLINGRAYKQEELLDSGKYKVLRVGNFFSNNSWYYSNLELNENQYVSNGDLMYAWSASFGPRFWKGEKTIYHYHIWKVVVPKNISDLFLYHVWDFVRQSILKKSQGGTMFHITKYDMEIRTIALPSSKEEQTAIATALSDTDALIAALEKKIAKKQQIKQGAMQQLLTGKKRLPGFSGEWVEKKLGECFDKIVGGGTPSRSIADYWNGIIPWATVKDFATFNANSTQEYITEEGLTRSSSNLIAKNTPITSTRMGLGKIVVYDVDVAINQDLKALYINRQVDQSYIVHWFTFSKEMIEGLGTGSTVKGIRLEQLKNIDIHLPDTKSEQTAIAQILTDMDNEIAQLEKKRDKYKELKAGMMQVLLTGKVRLM